MSRVIVLHLWRACRDFIYGGYLSVRIRPKARRRNSFTTQAMESLLNQWENLYSAARSSHRE